MAPLLLAGLLYAGSGIGLSLPLAVRAAVAGRSSIVLAERQRLRVVVRSRRLRRCSRPVPPHGWVAENGLCLRVVDSEPRRRFHRSSAWFAFKENFDRRIAIGMALIVAGGAALSMGAALRAGGFLGPLAIAGACFAWAIDNNLTRKVSTNDAMLIACLQRGRICRSISVALALRYGAHLPPIPLLLRAGLLGFVGYGLSLTLLSCAAELRYRANWRVFLAGAFYGRGRGRRPGSAVDCHLDCCGTLHGRRGMVASLGKPRPSTSSCVSGTRAFACP